ncbi:protein of unknown function [Nitrospira japonica]|uniref:Uncharacterized protein n=1 Tax=Nitrospira japonica TaxID=1325564 RepID=A0A1W1I367_9BACT|nr:protein of unknown function [Nitrospira japonica]
MQQLAVGVEKLLVCIAHNFHCRAQLLAKSAITRMGWSLLPHRVTQKTTTIMGALWRGPLLKIV